MLELVYQEEGEENISLWKKRNLLLFDFLCCWYFCTVLVVIFVKSGSVTGCRAARMREGMSSLLLGPRLT